MQQTTHIRVMIADDDTRARDEMISLMHTDEDISVVGAGDDAEQAIAIAKRENPDVAALDVRMPGGGGVGAAREITRVSPRTELIAISADDDPHDGAHSLGNRERRRRLEAMVRGEGIEVVYQPIFDLEGGSAVGAEALCRFEVSPLRSSDLWFREAVEQGLGNELEVTAVRHALRGLEQLDPSISLHVNVSPEACCSPKLRGLLEHVPGDRIVLEITENAPVEDYERLEAALTPLRNRGVGLAVDDACSGFASLRHALYLRPDTIKLDLSLTRGIEKDRARLSLVEAIVGFAPSVGAVVLAEGVENHEQLAALREAGVLLGQGHYLGRPKPMPHSGTWAALGQYAPGPAARGEQSDAPQAGDQGAGRGQPTTLTPSARPIE
jgi:EAL domain-containing protein (putative c-di-GMP-specific phosphodiesterase class I)